MSVARKEAICKENGFIAHDKCEICNALFIEGINKTEEELIISALEHNYSDEFTIDVKPTCTEIGTKSKHCLRCGSRTNVTELSAIGHEYGEWTVKTAATCTANGSKERVCTHDATHIETEEILATGHTEAVDDEIASTCTTAGQTVGKHCSVCNTILVAQEELPALGHEYGEWMVVKEATVDEEGQEERVCSHDSSHVEIRSIEKLSATPQKKPIDWKWIIIAIILAVIIVCEVAYLIYCKVRRSDKEIKK